MEARSAASLLKKNGRGAASNPANRFERLVYCADPADDEAPRLRTQFLRDDSRSIITRNNSPDVGFDVSLNPYRGCEHGCAYCYARPTHEFLGFSAGLDFETKIVVKENAPELLRRELSRRSWKPQVLVMSGVTDCYQPIERQLGITRRCLAVLAEFRNPVSIITKNHLVARDIDILGPMAQQQLSSVNISITTLDPELAKRLEPRASPPARRLIAIRELSAAGIPVSVMVAPIIPGLNDHEIAPVLSAAGDAGATGAGYTVIRLPLAVAPLFDEWLTRHFPGHREKVLGRVRSLRGGKLNESGFGSRMRGSGVYADQISSMFKISARRAGLERAQEPLSTSLFRIPFAQKELFE